MNRVEKESLRPLLECLSAVMLGATIVILFGVILVNAKAIESFFNSLAYNLFH